MRNQLSTAYDVFLEVRRHVDARLAVKLGRAHPDWRLKNACPACTYVLTDEPSLKFSMLTTIDGNNSIKRMERRRNEKNEDGQVIRTVNIECADSRAINSPMYLNREDVDIFKNEVPRSREARELQVRDTLMSCSLSSAKLYLLA
ncbi:MAG TPA: hypothetical protein VGO47_02560 [Chlamydiales bacterium]|jgi:hypothetical protein|nr:hypothetical protein [Chlamydiales bacterium]